MKLGPSEQHVEHGVKRRGVLLLVVLSMLTLFLLMGATYLITAARSREVAKAFSRSLGASDPTGGQRAKLLLDQAMMVLLRGPAPGPAAAISSGDSLLADKYGDAAVIEASVQSTPQPNNPGNTYGLFHSFTLTGPMTDVTDVAGRLLTFTSGAARGQTVRIIHALMNPTGADVVALATDPSKVVLNGGERCFLNGREFDSSTVNEDWDAPDEANMFLAWTQPEASELNSSGSLAYRQPWKFNIPSFHRPDQILAHAQNNGAFDPTQFRRPFGLIGTGSQSEIPHATTAPIIVVAANGFTGSNETLVDTGPSAERSIRYFDPVNGPWDVDNDSDGVSDSVWIDLGMPYQTLPDGRLAKPLFAIMCLDLDGRVNVNAHGNPDPSWRQNPGLFSGTSSGKIPAEPNIAADDTFAGAGVSYDSNVTLGNTPTAPVLTKGLGFGPAEVDLSAVIRVDHGGVLSSNLVAIVEGPSAPVEGPLRRTKRGQQLPSGNFNGLHDPTDFVPGNNGVRSIRERLTHRGLPDDYAAGPARGSSPIDLWGRTYVGLNRWGMPHFLRFEDSNATINPWDHENTNTPYAARPSSRTKARYGSPFSLAELEAVLRYNDADRSDLPQRLVRLLAEDVDRLRSQVTVDSWDTTALTVPQATANRVIRWAADGSTASIQEIYDSLLSWDFAFGTKMNINRPFGDGTDNDGNGTIDEPLTAENSVEGAAEPLITSGNYATWNGLTNGRDVNQDGAVDAADQLLARQLYARHLYVLAYDVYVNDLGVTMTNTIANELAQWAVNVVDFRDPDAIMTPFEYDYEPFVDNGGSASAWDVDGDLTTDDGDPSGNFRRVVWGMERPELLITEVLNWTDQRHNNGGVIIELYNPWRSSAGTADGPTHTIEQTAGDDTNLLPASAELRSAGNPYSSATGIDLLKTVPGTTNQPVWMIAYNHDVSPLVASGTTRIYPTTPNPGDNFDTQAMTALFYLCAQQPDPTITGASPDYDAAGATYGTSGHYPGSPGSHNGGNVSPGRFAVIASGIEETTAGTYHIPVDIATPTSGGATPSNGVQIIPTNSPLAIRPIPASPLAVTPPPSINPNNISSCIVCDYESGTGIASTNLARFRNSAFGQQRQVYLCRLANPLEQWDRDTNPYRIVDMKTVVEVVYNNTPPTAAGTNPLFTIAQSERGAPPAWDGNLWKADPLHLNAAPPALSSAPNRLDWTLGKLEHVNVPDYSTSTNASDAVITSLSGSLQTDIDPNPATNPLIPWLPWNNRDFTNPYELLFVPKASAANFMALCDLGPSNAHTSFLFAPTGGTSEATIPANLALFEFLTVPTQYALAESFLSGNAANAHYTAFGQDRPLFLPPHNRLPTYREPGRVNVNTLNSADIWRAINGGQTHIAYRDEQDVDETAASPAMLPFVASEDVDVPSVRPRNWRLDAGEDSNSNNYLDVNNDLNNDGINNDGTNRFDDRSLANARRGFNADLTAVTKPPFNCDFVQAERVLNRHGILGAGDRFFGTPFKSSLSSGVFAANDTLFWRSTSTAPNVFGIDHDPSATPHPATDPERSPFFRYRTINKLANTVTTRSNVFAVWITVGYFEANDPFLTPPDLSPGREVGYDTGNTVRHKAFYIIDRSIPVGFQPGRDHNARECVVLERMVN